MSETEDPRSLLRAEAQERGLRALAIDALRFFMGRRKKHAARLAGV
jgi:hypothetical protein